MNYEYKKYDGKKISMYSFFHKVFYWIFMILKLGNQMWFQVYNYIWVSNIMFTSILTSIITNWEDFVNWCFYWFYQNTTCQPQIAAR